MKLYSGWLLALFLLATISTASAQKAARFYTTSAIDTARNYTLVIQPEKGKPTGLVLLFPGFGETPADVLKETTFPMAAAKAGYVVAMPYMEGNAGLYLTDAKQQRIAQLVQDLQKKYKLQDKKIAVGGFSMGGTTAVKFAEYSLATPAAPKVSALLAVDPLLDMERFERSVLKAIQRGQSPRAKQMLQYMQHLLRQDFSTTPLQSPEKFYSISPYTYSDTANTAIKPLKQLPVLFYSEPDAANQFKTNQRDLYDLNTADCMGMIADLQSMGNQQAQLILSTGKGRRADGTVNPHSWSILEVDQTIAWLQQHLK
ncbi:alpha/beta hydrolase [Pontibacter sp. Tf4]|uniref:alpha/beta hydrolase n=1 Tax=Pontibacter sp. Tf4 TaxID=2761620 RepID=UPI0016288133|nr:alpha/beta hydrolase [Pontibacter sp. Tf4]MBB6611342.1 alpha/beta hydrolase [Pontibacter sp. Tf4]